MSGRIKKSDLPKGLHIMPFSYKIVWTNSTGASCHGETSTDRKEITINRIGPETAVQETLTHEALHVLLEDLVHMLVNYEGKEDDAEELFVRLFSPRLFEFIRNNPKFIEYISRRYDDTEV